MGVMFFRKQMATLKHMAALKIEETGCLPDIPIVVQVQSRSSLDDALTAAYFKCAARLLWSRVKCGEGSPHFFILDDFLDCM